MKVFLPDLKPDGKKHTRCQNDACRLGEREPERPFPGLRSVCVDGEGAGRFDISRKGAPGKVFDGLCHHIFLDFTPLETIGNQKRIVTEDVDLAGYPAGILPDDLLRLAIKEGCAFIAGDAKPMLDVFVGFRFAQRRDVSLEGDPLGKLTQFGVVEFGVQFGLAREDDLD